MIDQGWTQYIPFFALTTNMHTPIFTRLMEAFIIGGVFMYGTVEVLGERIDTLAKTQQEIKVQIHQIRTDFYKPVVP